MSATKEKIAVIGLGYVGLPLALLADKKGYEVVGIDTNREKIQLISKKVSPISDQRISKELEKSHLTASTDFAQIKGASSIIICVPTPVYDNFLPNLEPIIKASQGIGPHLEKGQLVILESTVNPGITENTVLPILEKASNLMGGKDFYLAHCPERINPGDQKWTVENIPRVVGSLEEKGLKKAISFYSSILTGKIKAMTSLKEAEACKVVENSFRDINIAFVNELAQSFSLLGIDIVKVIDGAATKPFAFMAHYPGCGVGGHCIPVDPYYLIEYAKQNGFNHDFLAWARRVNNDMPYFTAQRTLDGLNSAKIPINGAKIAVLGLSYKANIDDTRESPSYQIIKRLTQYGAKIITFDPHTLAKSDVKSLEEALRKSKAVVVATSHDYFKQKLTPELLLSHKIKVIVDGRNFLPKDSFINAGLIYRGIGR